MKLRKCLLPLLLSLLLIFLVHSGEDFVIAQIVREPALYSPSGIPSSQRTDTLALEKAMRELSIPYHLIQVSPKRAENLLKNGRVSAVYPFPLKAERRLYASFMEDCLLSYSHYYLLLRDEDMLNYSGHPEELEGLSIGLLKNTTLGDEGDRYIAHLDTFRVENYSQLISLLHEGVIDAAVITASDYVMLSFAKAEKGLTLNLYKIAIVPEFLAFSKHKVSNDRAEEISRAFAFYLH